MHWMIRLRRYSAVAFAAVSIASVAACASSTDKVASTASSVAGAVKAAADPAACAKSATLTSGKLTIATGTPAFSPWVENDKPESGEGFEAAVAYAIADKLGFAKDKVIWVRTSFEEAIQPGKKSFDFNMQQFSITDDRKKAVDMSSSYYTTNQSLVGYADSKAGSAKAVKDLAGLKLGAQAGTTSLEFINNVIKPSNKPFVYDDNVGAKAALESKQIDGIVVDLPTGFFISAVEIENTKVIGQFAPEAGKADQFGLVLDKGSKLTSCVDGALAKLTADGSLAKLVTTWLADKTGAPVFAK